MSAIKNERGASRPRIAVLGTGHFGRFHVEKYARHPGVEWVGCLDADSEAAKRVAKDWQGRAFSSLEELPEGLDAVSIATPAGTHASLARHFLEKGTHVLVEKPLAIDLGEAEKLVELAEGRSLILQVNHQERYFLDEWGLPESLGAIRNIEVTRLGPPPPRGSDCSVVLDILIHDLDWIRAFLPEEEFSVRVLGGRRENGLLEAVEAELTGARGAQVRLCGSRLSERRLRKARIVGEHGVAEVDFVERRVQSQPASLCAVAQPETRSHRYGDHPFEPSDYVGKSIAHFVQCLQTGGKPLTDGRSGLRALETTLALEAAARCIV